MQTLALLVACLACASHGHRVSANSRPVTLEALSALLKASNPDVGWLVPTSGLSRGPATKKATLPGSVRRTAAVRMQEEATLEQQLKDGLITQEEYDMLSSAVEEDEYLSDLEANPEEEQLSPEAAAEKARLSSSTGVEFAPWMKVDPEAIARAKKERAERQERLARESAGKRTDLAFVDPQASEVGAVAGIKSKILSQEEVELRWNMESENAKNKGFVIQRRKGRTEDWVTLSTWEDNAALRSKGPGGGTYVYLDDTANTGNWVYRVIDETEEGRSVVSQKLVEIESEEEQFGGYVAAAALFALFGVAWLVTSGVDFNSVS